MNTNELAQLIVLFILILLAAFFSSAESAYSSVNKLRIRSLADEGNKKAIKVMDLLEHSTKMLSAILIGNIIVTLVAAAITTSLAINKWGNSYIIPSTLLLIILVLVFGEVTPKFVAVAYSEELSLAYVGIIYGYTKLLTPVTFIFSSISKGLIHVFRINLSKETTTITEDELLTIVDVSHQEGVIESEERKMITNVVDFGDSVTKDVMVPRTDMVFGSVDMTYEELVEIFSIYKYTRIPIYSGTRDNIIGIINLKDLFFYTKSLSDFSIHDIMREPYFTYEYKGTAELFHEMKKDSIAIAIVIDEYGETAGLVTLEDLIEEIVGEIRDEYDEDEEDDIQKISDREFLVDGNTNLDEINETLGINLQSEEYESIAGYIIFLLDHIPEEGERVTDKNVTLTVDSIIKNRVDKVRIEVLPDDMEDNEDLDPLKTENII